jgi:hypothetical protein
MLEANSIKHSHGLAKFYGRGELDDTAFDEDASNQSEVRLQLLWCNV